MKDLFVDVSTGQIIETETTKESIAEMKALQESLIAEANAKALQRKQLLERLGLTEQEASLLLGS